MQVQFENGRRAEALVLAANRYEMRVVVKGSNTTEQWERLDGVWRDENGREVEIEALIAVDDTNWVGFCAEIGARAMALGKPLN